MNLAMTRKLMTNSQLECVTRGFDLSLSKTHLLVYHPRTVDPQTDLDLRTSRTMTVRMLSFYLSVPHCFLTIKKEPVVWLRAMRPWIIPSDSSQNILERINALNKEASLQKIVLSDGLFFDGKNPTPHHRGWLTLTAPVPERGFTTGDLETIITRMMAVPVEKILQESSSPSGVSSKGKIELPRFLSKVITREAYVRWLSGKARAHVKRDTKHHSSLNVATYKGMIHEAVIKSSGRDAYTGEMLDWSLLSKWRNNEAKDQGNAYKQKFALLPSVDHISDRRDTTSFAICSLRTNSAKSDLSVDEFYSLCRQVVTHLSQGELQ